MTLDPTILQEQLERALPCGVKKGRESHVSCNLLDMKLTSDQKDPAIMTDSDKGLASWHCSIRRGPVRKLHLTEAAVSLLTAHGKLWDALPTTCMEAPAELYTQDSVHHTFAS